MNDLTPRLLVIDDDPSELKLVRHLLTRARYQVATSPSGPEGLQRLDSERYDCVITDAIMPSMSGYELVKAIRRDPKHANLPVLMLTRKRHRQDVKRAVEVGVTDYVLKPIDEHLLLDKVELCLQRGGGTRHVFECAIHGSQGDALASFEARISSLSESDLTIRVPFALPAEAAIQLTARLFDEIGIGVPLLRLARCVPATTDTPAERALPFEARYVFVGIAEAELQKIRTWIQRQEIQRRK
jgi:CheY-like chemotaxis protein